MTYSGWLPKSEEECFVLIFPSGNEPSDDIYSTCWNIPGGATDFDFLFDGGNDVITQNCCCRKNEEYPIFDVSTDEYDDSLFLKAVIDRF